MSRPPMKAVERRMTEIIIKVDDKFLEFAKMDGMEDQYELIRCKDCKYWQFFDSVKANVCKRRYNGHWWTSHEDDFCSRAERKDV